MDFFGIFTESLFWSGIRTVTITITSQKEVSWIAGQLLLCLKPFVVFYNLVEDWSWEIVILRSIVEQSRTVEID